MLLDRVYRKPLLSVRDALNNIALKAGRQNARTAWKPIWELPQISMVAESQPKERSSGRLLTFDQFCDGLRRFEQLAEANSKSLLGSPLQSPNSAPTKDRVRPGICIQASDSDGRWPGARPYLSNAATEANLQHGEMICGICVSTWRQIFELTDMVKKLGRISHKQLRRFLGSTSTDLSATSCSN